MDAETCQHELPESGAKGRRLRMIITSAISSEPALFDVLRYGIMVHMKNTKQEDAVPPYLSLSRSQSEFVGNSLNAAMASQVAYAQPSQPR